MPQVAILDDYAGVALDLADWSPVQNRSEVTVFDRHFSEAEAADALRPFDVVCTLRERMAFPRPLIERLPNLKLITIVGRSLRPGRPLGLRESPIQLGSRRHSGTRLGVDDRDGAQSGRGASAHA